MEYMASGRTLLRLQEHPVDPMSPTLEPTPSSGPSPFGDPPEPPYGDEESPQTTGTSRHKRTGLWDGVAPTLTYGPPGSLSFREALTVGNSVSENSVNWCCVGDTACYAEPGFR